MEKPIEKESSKRSWPWKKKANDKISAAPEFGSSPNSSRLFDDQQVNILTREHLSIFPWPCTSCQNGNNSGRWHGSFQNSIFQVFVDYLKSLVRWLHSGRLQLPAFSFTLVCFVRDSNKATHTRLIKCIRSPNLDCRTTDLVTPLSLHHIDTTEIEFKVCLAP